MTSKTNFVAERITLTSIGYVSRDEAAPSSADKIATLRAETVRLVLAPRFVDALLGVAAGADLVLMTYFHLASHEVLQVHPRGERARSLRGVFATRSPARPNPIGLVTVRVVRIDGNVLWVRGLDALNGTPILDIKSYSDGFDQPYTL
jgi:tRNA (adenine37-N6)-methyltransferase